MFFISNPMKIRVIVFSLPQNELFISTQGALKSGGVERLQVCKCVLQYATPPLDATKFYSVLLIPLKASNLIFVNLGLFETFKGAMSPLGPLA